MSEIEVELPSWHFSTYWRECLLPLCGTDPDVGAYPAMIPVAVALCGTFPLNLVEENIIGGKVDRTDGIVARAAELIAQTGVPKSEWNSKWLSPIERAAPVCSINDAASAVASQRAGVRSPTRVKPLFIQLLRQRAQRRLIFAPVSLRLDSRKSNCSRRRRPSGAASGRLPASCRPPARTPARTNNAVLPKKSNARRTVPD